MKVIFIVVALVCSLTSPQPVARQRAAEETRMAEKLRIIPFGEINVSVLEKVSDALRNELGLTCTIEKALVIPAAAYNAERNQYLSTRLLGEMKKRFPDKGRRLLGIVDKDLYVPELNFVFGEADVRGKAAVISLTRLRQESYGLPRDDALFLKRAITEAVHELGHTYGLGHCHDPGCVMFFSNCLADTDRKGFAFCARCKRLLEDARRAEQKPSKSKKPAQHK
jgi:archaemetzincin